jgi:hypothetical protein
MLSSGLFGTLFWRIHTHFNWLIASLTVSTRDDLQAVARMATIALRDRSKANLGSDLLL